MLKDNILQEFIVQHSSDIIKLGSPLKLHFQIPCVSPVRSKNFPVPTYLICDYYIHKTDLADLSSCKRKFLKFSRKISNYRLPL